MSTIFQIGSTIWAPPIFEPTQHEPNTIYEYDQQNLKLENLDVILEHLVHTMRDLSVFEHILSNRGGKDLINQQKDAASRLVSHIIESRHPNKLSCFFILRKLGLIDTAAHYEFQKGPSAPKQKDLTLLEFVSAFLSSYGGTSKDGSFLLAGCVYLIAPPQTNKVLNVVFPLFRNFQLVPRIEGCIQSGREKSVAKNKLLLDALPFPTALLPLILEYSLEEDEEIASIAKLHPLQHFKVQQNGEALLESVDSV